MAVTTSRVGNYRTSADASFVSIASGTLQANILFKPDGNLWVYQLGTWAGRSTGTTATVRLATYVAKSDNTPGSRVGSSATVSASTAMTSASGGASLTASVSTADNAPTSSAFQLYAGTSYLMAIIPTVAAINVAASTTNGTHYRRTGQTTAPTPFGTPTTLTAGRFAAWATGEVNEPPEAPTNLSPTGTINDTAPTFTADFRDLNGAYGASSGLGANRGDRMSSYQVQLRQTGTTTLLWNLTYNAASSEQTGNAMSRAYGGSTLTRGTTYEWRVRFFDQFNEAGPWSSWTSFTPANLGFVTTDGAPSGKVLAVSGSTTLDFTGQWTHVNALSTNRVQIRLLSENGTVLKTSAEITKTVTSSAAPGTSFTITWSDSGFSTLAWGNGYQYQIRGRDSNNNWSDWSIAQTFRTDAAPSIPSQLDPDGSVLRTDLPLLTAIWSDPDSDDLPAGTLTGVMRVIRPDASTVDVTPTYNSTTKKWEFQTTATELSAYGTYGWRAIGYDGTLYSGSSTTLGGGSFSTKATFVYQAGPVFSVSDPDPAETITVANYTVNWSLSAGGPQAQKRVRLYAADTTDVRHDSGWISNATTSYQFPSGSYRNGVTYDLRVNVRNGTGTEAEVTVEDIVIAYPATDPPQNVQIEPEQIGDDPTPSAVRLSWDQTSIATNEFGGYYIYRREQGQSLSRAILLAKLTSPNSTLFYDYLPASGVDYIYTVGQGKITGADEVISTVTEGAARVDLEAAVLCKVGNAGTLRAVLRNVTDRTADRQIDEAVYLTLGNVQPTTVRGISRYWEQRVDAVLVSADEKTASDRLAEIEEIDEAGGVLCYRDRSGRKRFCTLASLVVDDVHGGHYRVALTMREENWSEEADA